VGVLTDLSGPAATATGTGSSDGLAQHLAAEIFDAICAAATVVLITDVHALGLKAAQGLLLTTSFYWDADDKTREWSNRFFAKINHMPTMWQAGDYSSVMHYLKAIQAAGTDEPLKVAAKMREVPVEDFFSRNGRLREDGLMVHDLMLAQVKKPEDSKYPW